MIKPNFLVIGASKAASTTLRVLLGRHPEVFCHEGPEPSFFSSDRRYEELEWSWYSGLFAGSEGCRWRGEKSNRYSERERFPATVGRIRNDLPPGTRFIYMVRDPLDRIPSMWLQKRSHGAPTHHDFARAVRDEPHWYSQPCNYLRQLEPYLDHYPAADVQVLFFEDFRRDPEAEMRRVFSFLEVDPEVPVLAERTHLNPTAGKIGDTATLGRLRGLPLYERLRRAVPPAWRRNLKERRLRRPMEGRPEWPAELRRRLHEQLAEDTVAFLESHGKPADFRALTRELPG